MTAMNQSVWGVTEDDIYLSPAPLYHAAPLRTCASVQALGGTVVVMNRFDPEKALEYIERYRITYSQWVPTMFVRLLKLPQETRDRYDMSSLRLAVHAAAPCPVDVKRKMIDWWGPILDEYYSSTELNGMTIVHSDEWLRKPGTVGRAALGVLHICGENGEDLPPARWVRCTSNVTSCHSTITMRPKRPRRHSIPPTRPGRLRVMSASWTRRVTYF
ncbi:hypothetical protein GCM10020255_049550 [Rhodococcus baikonurensis]